MMRRTKTLMGTYGKTNGGQNRAQWSLMTPWPWWDTGRGIRDHGSEKNWEIKYCESSAGENLCSTTNGQWDPYPAASVAWVRGQGQMFLAGSREGCWTLQTVI